MKSRDGMIRARRFQAGEKSRQVAQIEAMIADFDRKVAELDEQVRIEQERSGIHDTEHFAYPTFAKAVAQRRDNLKASIDDLKMQLDAARMEHDAVLEELQKHEAIAERDNSLRADDVAVAGQRG
jgi:flagellar FliJ protein